MYDSWDMEKNRQNFLSPWTIFYLFTPHTSPLTTQKVKILRNWKKKKPGDIVILQKWTIHDNHVMYGFWDMEWNWHIFCVVLDQFLPFYPLTICKIKILKKWTKSLGLLSFYKCVPQMTIIWCMVLEIWNAKDRTFCLFGTFFALSFP